MSQQFEPDAQLDALICWGQAQPLVRAVLLTSTRAIPGAVPDALSDYDVILVMSDIMPFHTDSAWLSDFGAVLTVYHDPLMTDKGYPSSAYVTQYAAGLKIDFSLWQVEILKKIVTEGELLPELDAGYRVLLDKDELAAGLKAPTYRAYIPTPPDEDEYRFLIENFLLEVVYVAKYLWRGDLLAARHLLDYHMKQEHLRPLLEWHVEMDRGWAVKPGPYWRRMQQYLRADLLDALYHTYTGVGEDESWAALDETIALMHRAALEVGQRLGYAYPQAMEDGTLALVARIRAMPR